MLFGEQIIRKNRMTKRHRDPRLFLLRSVPTHNDIHIVTSKLPTNKQELIAKKEELVGGTELEDSQKQRFHISRSFKQHVPKSVRTGQVSQDRKAFNRSCKLTNHEPICDSAIGQHLLTNQSCALHYSDDRFSILSKGRSAFHLSALEATYIKVSQPILCRQKEFVYALKISH